MRVIEAFGDYLQHERRYSPHTKTAYIQDVAQFFAFLLERYEFAEVETVLPMHLRAWMYELLQTEKFDPKSVNRKVSSLRLYFSFLQRQELLAKNPAKSVQGVKTEKRLAEWVQEKETESLFDRFAFTDDFAGQRDKLLLSLLYGTGMRLSELTGLLAARVYLGEKVLKVLGKRNKERIIPMHDELCALVRSYLEKRTEAGFGHAPTLLLTDAGKPLYAVFVQRKTKHYLALAGVQGKTNPHVLRHTFATHMLNEGADINSIKELLGHASLASTQVYTHNNIRRLKDIYLKAHPKS